MTASLFTNYVKLSDFHKVISAGKRSLL